MSKTVKCPKWGCDGVGIPVDTKKKFSFGKHLFLNVNKDGRKIHRPTET